MKTIKELMNGIETLNIPNGDLLTPNTKEWALMKLSVALDMEKDFDGQEDFKKVLNEWNEWFELQIQNSNENKTDVSSEEELPETYAYTSYGTTYEGLRLKVGFYMFPDFMGVKRRVPYLALEDNEGPFTTLTVGFGEFIGQIGTTYIDTNNNEEAEEFLLKNHIGIKTSFKKRSGFCEYPLFIINPKILAKSDDWEKYRKDFDFEDDGDVPTLEVLTKAFYELLKEELEN